MIIIIDYDAGNIHSVQHACSHCGYDSQITQSPDLIASATGIIIPGQGAFKPAMEKMNQRNILPSLQQAINNKIPILGICLGFQIMFETSDEHGQHKGLGLFPGHVTKIQSTTKKVPHMGWNECQHTNHPMFKDIESNAHLYFVHSYHVKTTDPAIITATTTYETPFVSAVAKGTLWGTQFHPEKSSRVGLKLLKNFLELTS
jgi:glutamine amidotransferase